MIPRRLPNVAKWPSKWVTSNRATIQTSPVVVQYNTELVAPADVPKTWTAFIDPKFRGKILLTDPRISDTYMGLMDTLGKKFGDDFLRKLAAQNLKLTQSGASGAQLVAAGSSALNFPAYASFSQPLIAKKAPIASRVLVDPTMVSQSSVGIAAKAPHPKTARLFVEWVLSADATRQICAANPISTPGDIEGKLGCEPVTDPNPLPYNTPAARVREITQLLNLSGK